MQLPPLTHTHSEVTNSSREIFLSFFLSLNTLSLNVVIINYISHISIIIILLENDENLEAEGEATKEGKEKDRSNVKNKCPGLDIEALSKCRVMGPPVTYDLPVHPFFLTASRKVVRTQNIYFITIVFVIHTFFFKPLRTKPISHSSLSYR